MDSQDLEASLGKSQALVLQAQQTVRQSMATLAQQRTVVVLAQQELDPANTLVKSGFETHEVVDQRQQALNGAIDVINADIAVAAAAAKAVGAAAQGRGARPGQHRLQHARSASGRHDRIPHRQYR
jgi:HlyD family secretion protein